MAYDPEKYRHKREKVLGLRKRGLGFQTLAIIITGCIVGGLALAALPGTVSWITTRNLDDAIYKLNGQDTWPAETVKIINTVPGIHQTSVDRNGSRLIITFDRTRLDLKRVTALFDQHRMKATLLNHMNHRHRMSIQEEEEAFETP